MFFMFILKTGNKPSFLLVMYLGILADIPKNMYAILVNAKDKNGVNILKIVDTIYYPSNLFNFIYNFSSNFQGVFLLSSY